jgi:transposase
MWTAENRAIYERTTARYPSDVTDEEWALVESHLPPPKKARRHPPPERREILNAILYVLTTGCQWRQLPKDFPPKSTVHDYLIDWQCDCVLTRIHHALYVEARERADREASPTTAIVDSQSVKSAEKGGRSVYPVGYDAGKKIKGKKRHAAVDTLGLMLGVAITPADVQDRDQIAPLLKEVRRTFPFLERAIADGGYQGAATAAKVKAAANIPLEIVKRSDTAKGFVVLPKRWIVERTFGWLGRCRRLAKDFENLSRMALAFVQLAMIRLMLRRVARL